MVKKSTLKLAEALHSFEGSLPKKQYEILVGFLTCYRDAVPSFEVSLPEALLFLELFREQVRSPHLFDPYHQKIRHPIDYYKFSLDFLRPLVDLPHSTIQGKETLEEISNMLKRGENVILLANHQIEPDPHAIAILLEQTHPELALSIISVAGERVLTDPMAIPFSLGCDLLCIYSKRYINHPPELKAEKQLHNKKTMEGMSRLLQEGGKIIYVAPSGGRDRKNGQGAVEVAPLDPASVEMIWLMAKKAKTPTHFYPLSLDTYALFPPPDTVQKELGERRSVKRTPIHLFFGPEFNMETFPGSTVEDKLTKRQNRAQALWTIINNQYQQLLRLHR